MVQSGLQPENLKSCKMKTAQGLHAYNTAGGCLSRGLPPCKRTEAHGVTSLLTAWYELGSEWLVLRSTSSLRVKLTRSGGGSDCCVFYLYIL